MMEDKKYTDIYSNYFKTSRQGKSTVEYVKQLGQATEAYKYFRDLYPEYFI